MHLKFSALASQFLEDPQSVRHAVRWPVLVWEAPPMAVRPRQPTLAEPLVLEVRKRPQGVTPPVPGITLGRTPDNDIIVEHPTVSRVHATFSEEKLTGVWYVVDDGSHNGTWHEGTLLIPGRPTPLFGRASLRFGEVLTTFVDFSAFNPFILDWLDRHSRGARTTHVTEGGLTRGS